MKKHTSWCHHISPTLFYRWWYTVCFGSFADPSIFHAFLSSHPPARFKCYSHLSKECFFKIALVSKSVLAKSNQAVLFLESCLTPGKRWEINFFLYHGKDPTIIHHCLPEIFVVANKTIKHSLLGQQQQLPNIRSVHITDPQWGFFCLLRVVACYTNSSNSGKAPFSGTPKPLVAKVIIVKIRFCWRWKQLF